MQGRNEKWIFDENKQAVSNAAARQLIAEINELLGISGKSVVTIALCGGTSPGGMFPELIEGLAKLDRQLSRRIHFVLTDERRVSVDDEQSNYRMLKEGLFDPLIRLGIIEPVQIHGVPVELEPEVASREYTRKIVDELGGIDIAILGVGPDGHVAALFPEHAALQVQATAYVYIPDRPKPPKEGFSASLPLLAKSKVAFLLFLGKEKQTALNEFRKTNDFMRIPACLARKAGKLCVFTDQNHRPDQDPQ